MYQYAFNELATKFIVKKLKVRTFLKKIVFVLRYFCEKNCV